MKETFYFSHDYNANQDPKIMALLTKCGLSGVGIYWILIELLHQQPNNKISKESYENYINFYGRFENEQTLNKIKQALIFVELLVEQDNFIFSKRVLENKKQREKISEIRSLAGKKSAEIRQNKTNAQQNINSCRTNGNIGKEIKGNKIIEIEGGDKSPTPKEIATDFFLNLSKQLKVIESLKQKGIDEQLAKKELNKFLMYWTEPDGTGKKQRWEKEKVFEMNRRLATWFSRINQFNDKFINNNRKKNKDGQWCIKKFGIWVLESNPSVNIDLKYYPELEN